MVALGIVVARFNRPVTEEMESAALDAADAADADVAAVEHVPGAFDAPLVADRLARRDDVDAVAVLGAVVTGDTDHDQVITRSTARTLQQVSLDRDKPVTLGITGPGMSGDEAYARTENGAHAVDAALDLVNTGVAA
ncbi:6,7-dimethyl-8-ribityllumazine synthase [Halocalculus aciditolerans]|uniref:6,7-dimethyl-8-ribityllumazine synthase n=1 Tax=Halocalculus aciditolerans TaxID=1383812 RepID=A0A830F498_9EURY|nr:6,7-dimethyl-8-ribityllumazine synthase [Halocalculus aciditolerans]GGL61244.1 6,7-dimethyl-8-ribityllumazine synthase [Halocalculus aciditolerans]